LSTDLSDFCSVKSGENTFMFRCFQGLSLHMHRIYLLCQFYLSHSNQLIMSKGAVYSIREFKRNNPADPNVITQITPELLEELKKDFPDTAYACIMIRDGDPTTLAKAEQAVREHPIIKGPATGNSYDRGSDKGQPPSSTKPLP
jgi:hypothetical protein